MTHEIDRDGEPVDVWDQLPDATDIEERYLADDDLAELDRIAASGDQGGDS